MNFNGEFPRILIFDSGVGGLSILQALRQKLPGASYFYACDNEAFPYGTKSEEALISRVDQVLKKLELMVSPDLVVVACNTASTVALPVIRSHFKIPVVGVVPAIKPAAAATQSGVIGLLATPGTAARPYTLQLIDDFASHCEVIRVGSSELVEIAEDKLRGKTLNLERVRRIIAPFFEAEKLDTIVLGCTHFPLLAEELQSSAPRPVKWIDSGEAIARRVESLLGHTIQSPTNAGPFTCLLTSGNDDLTALKASLLPQGCHQLDVITIQR